MSTQTQRGTYTRILPWAALAVMVVFFFLQVAARNRVVAEAQRLQERVQALEGGGSADAPAAAAPHAEGERQASRHMRAAYAQVSARAEEAEARLRDLTAQLERAEAVRAAQTARAEALAEAGAQAGAANGKASALVNEENEALERESAALIAQRDMLIAECEAAEQALTRERDTMIGAKAAWALVREELEARATRAEAAARREHEEAAALRETLALVQEYMSTMAVQAKENKARIAALEAAGAAPAGAREHVAHWLQAVADDPTASPQAHKRLDETFAALRAAWMAESEAGRRAHADAYVTVLQCLPRCEQGLATARRLTTLGMVPDDVLAGMVRALAPTHLDDPHSWTTLLLRGGPAVRAAILERLRREGADWAEPERAALGRALRSQLADADAGRRRDAAWGVGAIAHEGAAIQLVRLLGDDAADVRKAAAWALTRLKRSPSTIDALKKHAKELLDSPRLDERGEGIWLAQWVLGQPQNTTWLELTDAQVRRIAERLRQRLDQ